MAPSTGEPAAGAPAVVAPTLAARVPDASLLATLAGVKPPDPTGTKNGRAVTLASCVQDHAAALRLGNALI